MLYIVILHAAILPQAVLLSPRPAPHLLSQLPGLTEPGRHCNGSEKPRKNKKHPEKHIGIYNYLPRFLLHLMSYDFLFVYTYLLLGYKCLQVISQYVVGAKPGQTVANAATFIANMLSVMNTSNTDG